MTAPRTRASTVTLDDPLARARAGWPLAAYVLSAVFAAALASAVWRVPIQVSDSLAEILDAQRSPSVVSSFGDSLASTAYLRPLRIAQIKALFDLSGGNLWLAYRGFHVVLVVALIMLFTSALRVHSSTDFAAAAFALTVLTGLHTFQAFVREAFPINHFLVIAVLCVAALRVTQSRGGWLADAGAALLFAWAALTLESGLLVWVVLATAWACGLRGVSSRGLVIVTALLGGYFALRFAYLDTGLPALTERSSGFLLERLEPEELERRFGAAPLAFYTYNVATALLSVFVSEPRAGVFVAVGEWLDGEVLPRTWVALTASLATTVMIGGYVAARWRRRGPLGHSDRLMLVSMAVVAANGILSFAYLKDDIIAVAGVFYAFGAFVAARAAIGWVGERTAAPMVALGTLSLMAVAVLWSVRAVAVDHALRTQAFRVRNDWAGVLVQLAREDRLPADPAARALVEQLRSLALDAAVPNPQLLPAWHNRWFGD